MRGKFAIIFDQRTLTTKKRIKKFNLYFEINYENYYFKLLIIINFNYYLKMFSERASMLSNFYEI